MSTDRMKGVERFLEQHEIKGAAADQVREWARGALYWNALIVLDPFDIVTVCTGAQSHADMENGLVERIERRLDLRP